jgi:hypothetical protein
MKTLHWSRMLAAIAGGTLGLWLASCAGHASELPQLKLTADPRIGFSPASITVTILAKPDARNRVFALSVGANDSGFAASTQRTIDGENERGELARVVYRDVPAGNYVVLAALYDREGKLLARREVDVKRLARFD